MSWNRTMKVPESPNGHGAPPMRTDEHGNTTHRGVDYDREGNPLKKRDVSPKPVTEGMFPPPPKLDTEILGGLIEKISAANPLRKFLSKALLETLEIVPVDEGFRGQNHNLILEIKVRGSSDDALKLSEQINEVIKNFKTADQHKP